MREVLRRVDEALLGVLVSEEAQDFMEYAILGAIIGGVALATMALFRNELTNAINRMIQALRAAMG